MFPHSPLMVIRHIEVRNFRHTSHETLLDAHDYAANRVKIGEMISNRDIQKLRVK